MLRGHGKPIHGSCAIYFPGGITYIPKVAIFKRSHLFQTILGYPAVSFRGYLQVYPPKKEYSTCQKGIHKREGYERIVSQSFILRWELLVSGRVNVVVMFICKERKGKKGHWLVDSWNAQNLRTCLFCCQKKWQLGLMLLITMVEMVLVFAICSPRFGIHV